MPRECAKSVRTTSAFLRAFSIQLLKQNFKRLLAYLLDHPEELRPFSQKTRTDSKVLGMPTNIQCDRGM